MSKDEIQDRKSKYYEVITDEIKFYQEAIKGTNDNITKNVLTFSSAIIGFSVIFSKNLQITICSKAFFLLPTSWFFLLVAVLTMIISFFYGEKENQQMIDLTKDRYVEFCNALDEGRKPVDLKIEKNEKGTLFIRIGAISFALGLIFFILFSTFSFFK